MEDLFQPLLAQQWAALQDELSGIDTERRRLHVLRGLAMEALVTEVSKVFVHLEQELLQGSLPHDLIHYCSTPVRDLVHNAKRMARERIFKDSRKLAVEIGSYSTLGVLLDAALSAVRERILEGHATYRNQRVLELLGRSAPQSDWTLYQGYMRVIDFISGMTDNYAAQIARQFSGYQPNSEFF